MTAPVRRAELVRRPLVVAGGVFHSSLDDQPYPGSPLLDVGLAWTPTARAEIEASISWHSRPWWRRWSRWMR